MLARAAWNLAIMLRNQWLSPERLRELQNRKLRRLLHHAYQNVPYYRRLLDEAGLKPQHVQTVEDLQLIPLTSKEALQQLPLTDRLSRRASHSRCKPIVTSGSTGIPLKVYRTGREQDMRVAAEARMLLACLPCAFPRLLGVTARTAPIASGLLQFGPWRAMRVSPSESVAEIIRIIRSFKPHVLWGYPSRLHTIAMEMVERKLRPVSVQTVLTGSEVLEPGVRHDIARAFDAEIFDTYAALELGRLGWECRQHTGIHLCTDSFVFEIIRDGRPAEPGDIGEVVVTSLDLRAMPMIRYLLGDVLAVSDKRCPCGRGFPLTEGIEGRRDDMLVTAEGRLLSPRGFAGPVYNTPGVKQFRVLQDRPGRVMVHIVRGDGFPRDGAERIQRAYRNKYAGLRVEVRVVSRIPRDPSGKLRKIISTVSRRQTPAGGT